MIIARKFRVRVDNEPNAYYFTISQDEWGSISIIEIETPRGLMQYSIPLPQHVVSAMCEAMTIVEAGAGCLDSTPDGTTGITGVTGSTGCTGFTFL